MACCIVTAYFMNRLIKACEVLDLKLISIQYNQFDDGPGIQQDQSKDHDAITASKFMIQGMTCTACTTAIEKAILDVQGIERVSVSLPLARATVVHKPSQAPAQTIVAVIEAAGYGARMGQRTAQENLDLAQQTKEIDHLRQAFNSAALLSTAVSFLDYVAEVPMLSRYSPAFQLAVIVVGAWVQLVDASWIHQNAWTKGPTTLTMDSLISLSLLLGLGLSFFKVSILGMGPTKTYFASGSFLTTVVIGGRYLDHVLKKRSASNLAHLYRLQTESTSIMVKQKPGNDMAGSTALSMPAALLQPQDEIIIAQDSIVPADCYVIDGRSMIDQSTMTGESVPVNKGPGEFLMSGTRNLSYELVAIVVKEQQESMLEQLISSVSSSTEVLDDDKTDVLTSHFVKIILGLTLAGFSLTYCFSKTGGCLMRLTAACERAMAILASACPCALGLIAPSAVMAAIDVAWTRGVIIKGGLPTIKTLTKLSHIVMDKTGTLTTGKFSVASSSADLGLEQLMYICAAERQEAHIHPVAQTVFKWALSQLDDHAKRQQNEVEIRNYHNELGKGITCEARLLKDIDWKTIHVGTAAYLSENGISVRVGHATEELQDATEVYVSMENAHLTTLTLCDTVRPDASSVISHLKDKLWLDITMLTGDVPAEALRVSKALAIPVLASQTLPHEKAKYITDLRTQAHRSQGKVAMIGDGLNDTPSLAAADVGIFLSPTLSRSNNQGQPQSSTAGIILISPSLKRLPEVLEIARKTVKAARWIRNWAIGYNIIAVSLAMGLGDLCGYRVDAARAGSMMALSSVSVLSGSLLLRRSLEKVDFRA